MIEIVIIRKNMEIEKLKESLIALKYKCYQAYLRVLDDEFLRYEYADRIGNDLGEADWLLPSERRKIIDRLEDNMANLLYDDPMLEPVNKKYWEACKPLG